MAAKTGLGTVVTFSTSTFTAQIIDIPTLFDVTRGSIEASNMASVDWIEKIPEALADAGQLEMEIEYDGSVAVPLNNPEEDISIDVAGEGTGKLVKGKGFISGFKAGVPHKDKMTGTVTVEWTEVDFAQSS